MDSHNKSIIFLYQGYALCWSRFVENSNHSHHAIQVVMGLHNDFQLFCNGVWHTHESVIIAPNVSHRLVSPENNVLLLLIDHEMEIAKRLSDTYLKNKDSSDIDPYSTKGGVAEIISQLEEASCQMGQSIWVTIMDMLLGPNAPPVLPIDPRIKKALDIISELPIKKISTSDIASQIYLSESRFLHLFKDNIGIPVRRYLLWKRLNEAVRKILGNISLTEAAHAAGFSDSAHLSRTFRSMFGLTISEVFKKNQHVRVYPCME
jgi:AraC-like DNA-binding protein